MTATRIYTYDSTLRDGEQCEGITLSLADKLAIVRRLDEFGIDYIAVSYTHLDVYKRQSPRRAPRTPRPS